ncbi:MAG: Stk1 family PASTA domain-containing Ser/Thr kinase [Eubacteriales bacterium]|nr:Stk1 family PASTA domain-containing Ser/Thr kinase [Eubacteriales bacterium]
MQASGRKDLRGSLIGGRYRIIRTLGQGGMAFVYLVYDENRQRECAVKLMREDLMDDPEFVRRFATEARAAASLDHPNIVRVLDYGQDGDLRYIVQEYVRGSTLKDLIYDRGGLNWQLAVPLMIQISLALQHAHTRGIIHRDMKPQNVLVTPDMIAKVTDFGIARAQAVNTITLTGGVAFGSVHYFSPEQARGAQVTVRSDLYSLGIMLYEMLLAELPFDGESSVAVAIKQLQEMPTRPSAIKPDIPSGLDDIIFRAIQKNPERRYASAADFANELDAFMIDPDSVYGVIPRHASANPNAPPTSALGLQKQESNYDKVHEIEEKIARRRRSRFFSSALIFVVIVVCVLALSLMVYRGYEEISRRIDQRETTVEFVVGRYQGKQLEIVRSELEAEGVAVEVVYEKNATVQLGYIFRQEPESGIKLQADERTVRLYVSQGEEKIALPNVEGKTASEAMAELKSQGFDVVEKREYSKTIEEGKVIKTEPKASSELALGATVYLYVSDGEAETIMPEIIDGMSFLEAKALIEDARLEVQAVRVTDSEGGELPESERVVIAVSVEAGTKLKSGSQVVLTYGSRAEHEQEGKDKDKDNDNSQDVPLGAQFSMPNLNGSNYSVAYNNLLSAGWPDSAITVIMTEAAAAAGSTGQYVISTRPEPGTTLVIGRDGIELYVGTYQDWVNSVD